MIPIAAPELGEEEQERVLEVIESGMLADGPEVRHFEEEFAAYCGSNHAVATSNGTTALHAALAALEIGEGARVITTPFSFIASANAIRLVGAEPVFADIDPRTFNLDPNAVARLLAEDPDGYDAILAVHLYGLPADLDRLCQLADTYGLALIEDCAQAHGAHVDHSHVGTFGDVGCFSFYPTKNMTTGEGGMITTDDAAIAERAASFANHGRVAGERGYDHDSVGHNFRMTSIAAAIGRVQLERLPDWVSARRANGGYLRDQLREVATIKVPVEPPDREHAYHQFTIRAENRARLRDHLKRHGISTGIYYPRPIPDEPAYEGFDVEVPNARQVAEEVVSLPIHQGIDGDDIETMVEVILGHVRP